MKVEIKKEYYNKFLKRKELDVDIEHPEEATPSTAALQQIVSKQASTPAESTEIMEIITAMGAPVSKGLVFVWDDKKVKDLSKKEEVKQAEGESRENAEEKPPEKT